MRRPLLFATASAALMLVLAIPALSLETGDGALRQFPEGNETRTGAELAARQAGPGASGPAQVLVDSGDRGTLARFAAQARRDPEAAAVSRPELSRDGRSALITVEPRHDPESPEARAMVDRLGADAGWPAPTCASAARPRRSRTSRTWSAARCGRSRCSCWPSAT